jgi:hypothetical protein
MEMKISPRCVLAQILVAGVFLGPSVLAQSTALLEIETIEIASEGVTRFTFEDQGSGATNYAVEYLPSLEEGEAWSSLDGVAITDLGLGSFSVVTPDSEDVSGFYRVRALGGAAEVSFVTTAFRVTEGGTVAPTLVFNAPFFGTIQYTISGTVESGDYVALSGELVVNGATATIPVAIIENAGIGELKHLTLNLIDGPGYRVGAGSQTTIVIDENDAEWRGSFAMENAGLTFVLRIQQTTEGQLAWLKSDGFGFFPTTEQPAVLTFTEDTFAATVQGIPVNPEASLFGSAMNLSFVLNATNGEPNQSVESNQIQGVATLIAEVPGKTYLNTTNHGTFVIVKPRTAPSTNQVELVRTD